jgi:predicted aspartyl protease
MNPRTGASAELVALADTGATLTVAPATLLDGLGIRRVRRASFLLANGERVERDVGDAAIVIDGKAAPSLVVFGGPDDPALLGLTALEQLGLVVDPVQRRLVPTDYLLI